MILWPLLAQTLLGLCPELQQLHIGEGRSLFSCLSIPHQEAKVNPLRAAQMGDIFRKHF